MKDIMRNVSKPGATGRGGSPRFHGLCDRKVRWVGLVTQSVHNEMLHPGDTFGNLRRDGIAITKICGQLPAVLFEKETRHGKTSVRQIQRSNVESPERERPGDLMWLGINIAGKNVLPIEGKIENSSKVLQCFRGGVDGNRLLRSMAEPSEVIESHDMICVRVSVEHCIEVLQTMGKRLHAEVRSGVHHKG
jgi:hypothetical protein